MSRAHLVAVVVVRRLAVLGRPRTGAGHAQALLCIAHDPGVRLREIASTLGITERAAFGIVTDLVEAGYVVKDKNGRRNRYGVQVDKPLPEVLLRQRTVGQLVDLLAHTDLETHDR